MTVQETIAHLDELRGNIGEKSLIINHQWATLEQATFIKELVENYDTLRKAALAGAMLEEIADHELTATEVAMKEREQQRGDYIASLKKRADAGAELAKAVEKMHVPDDADMCICKTDEEHNLLMANISGLNGANKRWRTQRDAALDTYKKSV